MVSEAMQRERIERQKGNRYYRQSQGLPSSGTLRSQAFNRYVKCIEERINR